MYVMLPAFHPFRFTLIYLEDSSFLTIINIRAPGTFMFRAKYIYVLCKGFCVAKVGEEKCNFSSPKGVGYADHTFTCVTFPYALFHLFHSVSEWKK